ncbi:Arginine N-succinyltransferase [Thalassoglobus neptunius]|uniref:Arginine N-succinyltransferase n=1 Tax=Thalassoglobus neptunius TaxID=1938619 RepID=A0A5C5WBP8_9PLAN|nr:arginine N-succinyltransferase [Thalassoglobus neptunius]TWT47917.1 Arginine N-succinyltransferase [Thalassoglobus neptunius]
MFVIRPVELDDLDDLASLADLTSFGLTTLPRDHALLEKRVRESVQSFANIPSGTPRGQSYLLVLEDLSSSRVIGTSGILSKVGGFEPFYAYRIEMSIHESTMLQIRKEVPVLHLVAEHDGPCEIGSLFLHPDYRHGGNGRLLSLSRFLMIAQFPHLFDSQVIAEMRGVINDQGQSPFWDAIGKHFFDLEFPKADYLSIVNKEFIGDLMPVHPIYINLLPQEAQAVIGEVHENTVPARKLLESEGFRFNQMIDIFEAGPILEAAVDSIRAVRDSRGACVVELVDHIEDGELRIVGNTSQNFRATTASLKLSSEGVTIERSTAEALQIELGDIVRHVTPKGAQSQPWNLRDSNSGR